MSQQRSNVINLLCAGITVGALDVFQFKSEVPNQGLVPPEYDTAAWREHGEGIWDFRHRRQSEFLFRCLHSFLDLTPSASRLQNTPIPKAGNIGHNLGQHSYQLHHQTLGQSMDTFSDT